jgi:hypothetical protein
MALDEYDESATAQSRRFRFRFSLLALLIVVTIASLLLAWWKFVHLHERNLLATRDLLAQRVEKLNSEIAQKLEEYVDIEHEMGRDARVGNVLLEQDIKRLDRIDVELMRLEGEQAELPQSNSSPSRASIETRIANLRKQQAELQSQIERRSERSAELELRHRDIQRLQQLADELSLKLEYAELEVQKRGL